MDPSQAVEYGRVHHQLYPERVRADNVVPALVLDGLRDRGHEVEGTSSDVSRPCHCSLPLF